jgi:hypothetical protein
MSGMNQSLKMQNLKPHLLVLIDENTAIFELK